MQLVTNHPTSDMASTAVIVGLHVWHAAVYWGMYKWHQLALHIFLYRSLFYTLWPEQNGCCLQKRFSHVWIWKKKSQEYIHGGLIDNTSALVQFMAWSGIKSLPSQCYQWRHMGSLNHKWFNIEHYHFEKTNLLLRKKSLDCQPPNLSQT